MVDSRRVSVGVDANVSPFVRGMATAAAASKAFSSELESADSRMSNLVQTGLALAPAMVPIGAVAVPAIAGLSAQLGAAAGAASVALLAFNGMGDALGALSDYRLEPTAENLEKVNEALASLGPAGADFARFLDSVRPKIDELQNIAREGLFPGAQTGIEELLDLMPEFGNIVGEISGTLGNLLAEAGDNLNDERWVEFFDYIAREAEPTLTAMGRTLGNFTEGLANMLMAFDPLSDDFTGWFLDMSRAFADWSADLSESNGFQEFVDYVRDVGPQVSETFGALVNALVQLTEAAAPVGQAVLPVIETLANVLAQVADSPVGPVLIGAAAGVSAMSRSVALWNAANASAISGFLGKIGGQGAQAGAGARLAGVGLGVLAVSLSDLDDKAGLSNTAMFALLGTMAGPWGTIAGGAAGLTMDLAAANNDFAAAVERANAVLGNQSSSLVQQQQAIASAREEYESFKDSVTADNIWEGFINNFNVDAILNQNKALATGTSEVDRQKAALEELEAEYDANVSATGRYAAVQDQNADGIRDSTDAILANLRAMEEHRREALASSDAMIAYEQSMDDARKALKENGRGLDLSTQKGRDNQSALNAVAASWNNMSAAQQNADGAFKQARRNLISTAEAMGMSKGEAREYANAVLEIPPARQTQIRLDGISQAMAELSFLNERLDWIARPRAARISVTTVYSQQGYQTVGGLQERADGGTVLGQRAPYGDKVLTFLAPGEEVISNRNGQADRHRELLKAINAGRFADGGTVGGLAAGGTVSYDLDQRMELARLQQQVNQLRRDLAKDGKESLKGLNRTIARLELESTQRDLRQARRAPVVERRGELREVIGGLLGARGGFDIDADMSVADVRSEIAEFRKEILEAGGEWTKGLRNQSKWVVRHSQAINKAERAIVRETEKREALQDKLDDASRAFEELQRTAHGFRDAVAGNFMSDPFNLSIEPTAPAAPPPSAELTAARGNLSDAKARYRAALSLGGDPLERSYKASRILAEIDQYQAQVDELDQTRESIGAIADPAQKAVTGLEAFRQALESDIERAERWGGLMDTLLGKGLDPNGALFAGLAQSGDFATAGDLAALTPAQIDQFEALIDRRDEVVATVATRAMDAVYREEMDRQVRELRQIQSGIDKSSSFIERQTNVIERRSVKLENTVEREMKVLQNQVGNLRGAIANVSRQQETNRQKRGKR